MSLFNALKSKRLYLFLFIYGFLVSNNSSARIIYFSNSGNDTYSITQAQNPATPWKSLQKLQSFATNGAAAGDTFSFKCGDVFIGPFDRYGSIQWGSPFNAAPSGTSNRPIVFTSYGAGAKPNFLFPNPSVLDGTSRIVFAVDRSSHIIFDGLQFNDYRFPANDKVSTCYTKTGILLGEENARSNNCIIRNCTFNNIGCGVQASGNYLTIENNIFTNLKNWGDTATMADIGCVPMSISSGKYYLIKGNYMKGGWGFTGATASGQGLNGVGIELINDIDSSRIINNTIVDCAGGIEYGNITSNTTIGASELIIAYNKFINNGYLCYLGVGNNNSSKWRFWNNVYIENQWSRFTGTRFGTDTYGDGQSFAGFTNWPTWPKNPSIHNYGGFRIIQYPTESTTLSDTLIDMRNNVFWMTNKNQAVYDNTRIKTKRANNIFHIVGQAALGGTLNSGNFLESVSSTMIFTDTTHAFPENWNFQPYTGSPAINFGRNVGLNGDFSGAPIVSNPDAGIHEFSSSVASPLVAAASAGNISCFGGAANVNVSATGGMAPYTGIGNFSAVAGITTLQVRDALGNTANVSVNLIQPAQLNVTASTGRIIVYGGNTTISVAASGGTGPYTYQLNNGLYQSGNSFTGVLAGTHILNTKDANGCVTSRNIIIVQPASPLSISLLAASNPLSCNGGSTIVTVTATGGTAPYTGTGNFSATAGTNTYIVADSNGVSVSASINITQPAALSGNATAGNISAYGAKTTITVSSVTGGTSPYTYALNGGAYQTSNVFNNVGAGTYQVMIKDAKNCILTKAVNITQPPTTLTATATSTTIMCNGSASTVTVNATGGTAPYTGTGTFTALAGNYSYTVTDAVGATKTASITITQPPAIVPAINTGRIIVFGGSTNATVTATGGRGTLTYKLNSSNYQTSGQFNGIQAGTNVFYVKDSNNCIVSQSRTLTQPAVFSASATTNGNIICNGGTTTVTVTATGGTAPYQGVGTFNVAAGNYNYTVTDSNGVTRTTSINVAQPTNITASVSYTTISTFGAKSTINISSVTGGTSPYTYSLNNGTYQSTASFSNVAAGAYMVYIKDSKGCVVNYPLNITQPPSTLACNATPSAISCFGGNATVTVTATGGTSPYQGIGNYTVTAGTHTFSVTDAVGSVKSTTINIGQPALLNPGGAAGNIRVFEGTTTITLNATGGTGIKTYKLNNGNYQTSNVFSNILAGIDTVYVKDANNCIASQIIVITQPQPLVATVTGQQIACNGGSTTVSVTASGGVAPYIGTGTFNVTAGTYTYVITDANGITASSNITISQPAAITANASSGTINNSVYPATATITVSSISGGISPYSYALNNGSFQSATNFNNTAAGQHVIAIKDANNCTVTRNVTITQPLRLLIAGKSNSCIGQSNGSYTFTAVGGKRPYRYKIATSSSSLSNATYYSDSVFSNLSARVYFMRVRDSLGNTFTTSDTIASISCNRSGENIFPDPLSDINDHQIKVYPNPSRDFFQLQLPEKLWNFNEIKIYDSKGLAISHYNLSRVSAGKVRLSVLMPGMYFVIIGSGENKQTIKLLKL
jgi:hypothetical protein